MGGGGGGGGQEDKRERVKILYIFYNVYDQCISFITCSARWLLLYQGDIMQLFSATVDFLLFYDVLFDTEM